MPLRSREDMPLALDSPVEKSRVQFQGRTEGLDNTGAWHIIILCHIHSHTAIRLPFFVKELRQAVLAVYVRPLPGLELRTDVENRDNKSRLRRGRRRKIFVKFLEVLPSCSHKTMAIVVIRLARMPVLKRIRFPVSAQSEETRDAGFEGNWRWRRGINRRRWTRRRLRGHSGEQPKICS